MKGLEGGFGWEDVEGGGCCELAEEEEAVGWDGEGGRPVDGKVEVNRRRTYAL